MGARHRHTDRHPQHTRFRAKRNNIQLRSHQVSFALLGGVPSCKAEKLVSDGTILSYLTDLDRFVAEAIERQVGMMLENDTEYLRTVAVGDLAKARGLENMDRLIARDPVYAAMVYV